MEYDVALSFASEDRKIAEELTSILTNERVRVFYDINEQASLWGKDLYQHLQEIYRDKAKYCIIFISKYYIEKAWTKHELKQAQARAFNENTEYILPIRLDDTEIPGINPTVAYIDIRKTNIKEIANLLIEKIKTSQKSSDHEHDTFIKKHEAKNNIYLTHTLKISDLKGNIKDFEGKTHSKENLKYLEYLDTLSTLIYTTGEILFFDFMHNNSIIQPKPFKGVIVLLHEKGASVQYMPHKWDTPTTKWGVTIPYNFQIFEKELNNALSASSLKENNKLEILEKTLYCIKHNFSNLIFDYGKNDVAIFTKNQKYGLINKLGDVIISPSFNILYKWEDIEVVTFHQNKVRGIIDFKGNVLFEAEIDQLSFEDVENKTISIQKNNKYGLANYETGKITVPPKYDFLRKKHKYGRSYDVTIDNKAGVINDSGDELIKLKFSLIELIGKYI